MTVQTVEFAFSIKQSVFIKEIKKHGTVISLYYGETGAQYNISYFHNGERKTAYMYEKDIWESEKQFRMGFQIDEQLKG